MRQNNTNSNSIDAVRTLLAVEMLINPSAISLPSIPANIAAKKYLTMTTQSNSLSFSNSNLINEIKTQKDNDNNNEKDEERTEISTVQTSKGAFLEGNNQGSLKRGRDEDEDVNEEDVDNKKRLKKDGMEPFSMTSNIGAAFKIQNNQKNVNEKDEEDDDEDDDSLPDIDIEADPEK